MFFQTLATPTSFSPHCVTLDLNRFSESSTPFLLKSCYNRSQKGLLFKSKSFVRVRPPCCLSKTDVGNGESTVDENGSTQDKSFPKTIPRKPRRGRKSEAVAVEDFIRNSLEKTFATIREKSSEVPENMEHVMKDQTDVESDSEVSNDEDKNDDVGKKRKKMVVDDESKSWPLDADVGWGTRASEYFDEHAIRNTVGEDGVEIDWEGEMDEGWVKEINCLEWEDFAFHPSPLIVLVFERYNRASDNWKVLQELEKAAKVYWENDNCLPPRTVKIDINIERDLAYALKVKEGPELLFLRGNRIIYRDKNIRTSDELVQMIAHFYYKAKKPAWI